MCEVSFFTSYLPFFFFFKLFLDGLVGEEDPHVQPGLSALVWEEVNTGLPGATALFQ